MVNRYDNYIFIYELISVIGKVETRPSRVEAKPDTNQRRIRNSSLAFFTPTIGKMT